MRFSNQFRFILTYQNEMHFSRIGIVAQKWIARYRAKLAPLFSHSGSFQLYDLTLLVL